MEYEIEFKWSEKLYQKWGLMSQFNEEVHVKGGMISKCPRGQYIHGKENVNACPQGIDTWSKLVKFLST